MTFADTRVSLPVPSGVIVTTTQMTDENRIRSRIGARIAIMIG